MVISWTGTGHQICLKVELVLSRIIVVQLQILICSISPECYGNYTPYTHTQLTIIYKPSSGLPPSFLLLLLLCYFYTRMARTTAKYWLWPTVLRKSSWQSCLLSEFLPDIYWKEANESNIFYIFFRWGCLTWDLNSKLGVNLKGY